MYGPLQKDKSKILLSSLDNFELEFKEKKYFYGFNIIYIYIELQQKEEDYKHKTVFFFLRVMIFQSFQNILQKTFFQEKNDRNFYTEITFKKLFCSLFQRKQKEFSSKTMQFIFSVAIKLANEKITKATFFSRKEIIFFKYDTNFVVKLLALFCKKGGKP